MTKSKQKNSRCACGGECESSNIIVDLVEGIEVLNKLCARGILDFSMYYTRTRVSIYQIQDLFETACVNFIFTFTTNTRRDFASFLENFPHALDRVRLQTFVLQLQTKTQWP